MFSVISEEALPTEGCSDMKHDSNPRRNMELIRVDRNSKLTPEQENAILPEVTVAQAHVAIFRGTRKRYETTANHIKDNPPFFQSCIEASAWQMKKLQWQYDAY